MVGFLLEVPLLPLAPARPFEREVCDRGEETETGRERERVSM